MYKKFYSILLYSFIGVFILEIITTAFGHPIVNINIAGVGKTDMWRWITQPVLSAFFVCGIINIFLIFKILKKLLKLNHWPVFAIVLFTVFFPLEILIGLVLLIPNIIVFMIKGKTNE